MTAANEELQVDAVSAAFGSRTLGSQRIANLCRMVERRSDGNTKCCGKTWNRDVNASRNILRITLSMVLGLPMPSVFTRRER